MKVIKPTHTTQAMVVSTTASETYAEYNAGTAYALDAQVTIAATGRMYRCIQGPSTGNAPATSPLWWVDIGPSNKWAMFDSQISTATTHPTALTVVLDTGYVNSLALVGVLGASATVTATDGAAGPTVYSRTIPLDGTLISDWYQYFFEAFNQLGEVVITDIPTYLSLRLTVSVTGVNVAVGNLAFGTSYDLGQTEYGASASIIDYSRKDTSALGVTTFVQRQFSKRMSARMMLPTAQANKVQRVLADVRATPCVWIGSDDTATYAPLVVFGFYRDFSIDIAYALYCYCSLEIEGLT